MGFAAASDGGTSIVLGVVCDETYCSILKVSFTFSKINETNDTSSRTFQFHAIPNTQQT